MTSLLAHSVYDVAKFMDGRDSFSPDAFRYYRLRLGLGADIEVKRRFADFTYDVETGRRKLLENQIETNETVLVDALGYMSIFDLLFPKLGSFPDSDPITCQFFVAAADYFANIVQMSIEPFVLPLTHQQNNYFNPQNETLLNATFRQQSYRIVLEPSCFVIYICLSLISLLWSIILLALSGQAAIPEGNELDVMDQLATDSEDLSIMLLPKRLARNLENRQNKSCRTLGTVRVLVGDMDDDEQLLSNISGDGIALQAVRPVPENEYEDGGIRTVSVSVNNEQPPADPERQGTTLPVKNDPRPGRAIRPHPPTLAALPQLDDTVPDSRIKIVLIGLLPRLAFKCPKVKSYHYSANVDDEG